MVIRTNSTLGNDIHLVLLATVKTRVSPASRTLHQSGGLALLTINIETLPLSTVKDSEHPIWSRGFDWAAEFGADVSRRGALHKLNIVHLVRSVIKVYFPVHLTYDI